MPTQRESYVRDYRHASHAEDGYGPSWAPFATSRSNRTDEKPADRAERDSANRHPTDGEPAIVAWIAGATVADGEPRSDPADRGATHEPDANVLPSGTVIDEQLADRAAVGPDRARAGPRKEECVAHRLHDL